MNDKPSSPEEYLLWLKSRHRVEITERTLVHYEAVAEKVRKQFVNSRFWKLLGANLKEYNDEYYVSQGKGYELLPKKVLPEVEIKQFEGFLLKTFRENVLENGNWVEEEAPPTGGWILPNNWYSRINDIVRTCFVVRYLDGVYFIRNKIQALCKEDSERDFDCKFKAKEEGYYAAHIYTWEKCEIPRSIEFGTEEVSVSVEIQITTQLKEVIVDLLHKYYDERRRKLPSTAEELWQWDYTSEEFATNYLGHILHYVDGMIVGIREKE